MLVALMGAVMVVAAVWVGSTVFAEGSSSKISKERMNALRAAERKSTLTRVSDGVVATVEQLLSRRGWRPFSAVELELAGVRTPVASLVVLVLCGMVTVYAAVLLLSQSPWWAVVPTVFVPVLTKLWIRVKASRRTKRFGDQLPQTLQMMAASLRAGHSFPRALDTVAQEAEAPMSDELARVVNETRLGRGVVEALEGVSVRMKSIDFYWVAGAIAAQRETGGNLNEILDQVAETIRERHHVRQQVRALSAEGRLSAYILMALPVGIGGYYALVSGGLWGQFIDSGIGKLLILGSLIMYTLGGFWMKSIVDIEF